MTLAGRDVNRIGLGTNRLTDTPENHEFLKGAVDAGIETIDTAHLYTEGSSEAAIGNALAPGDALPLVATKGGFKAATVDDLRTELEQSFERLHTDRIELYYVHRLLSEASITETMELLASYVEAGRIGHIGLSEVGVEQIEEARETVSIAAVQNEFSLAERKHDAVVDHCAEEGIAFVPFFPLRADDEDAVADVARAVDATPNQVKIAWLLRRSPAMLPIPGTLSIEHVRENVAALDLELSEEDFARLSGSG